METLSKEIKTYFDAAVTIDYDGLSNTHPIIVLNALKNIIGDNRKQPSRILLDSMKKLIDKYPKRTDDNTCLLYTSPSPRDQRGSRMPSSA